MHDKLLGHQEEIAPRDLVRYAEATARAVGGRQPWERAAAP
jgi:hypothetical protein